MTTRFVGGSFVTMLLLAYGPACLAQGGGEPGAQAPTKSCAEDAGITLPPGFCATVFADKLGHARQLVVAPNGVVYVNTWSGRYYHYDKVPPGGFLLALQDTTGDGHADKVMRFGETQAEGGHGGTGVGLYHNWVYAEINDRIVRYALPSNGIAPTGKPETIVSGLPLTGDHPMHPFMIDAQGNMYVDLGSATNSCQSQNRMPKVKGEQPCTELKTRGGTWRYDANRTGQRFSPAERFATGIRNGEGISQDSEGRIFVTQHGRDQLSQNWPSLYTQQQGANEPAEEIVLLQKGHDYGWPECYYDSKQKKLVLAPEYGGDGGKKVGVCAQKQEPVATFPAHWAPNDLLMYEGRQFPSAYKDGAFVAFHGSWNRAPEPQGGYNVVFQPFADGKASGPFVVFADGFAGAIKEPGRAAHRPSGVAMGPDGSLYISDDIGGRIWRVTYQGGNPAANIEAAAPAPGAQAAASSGAAPPEGIHPEAGTQPTGHIPTPPGSSPKQVAEGARLFHSTTCAGCHGSDGSGSEVGSNLTSGKWLWSNGSVGGIAHTISTGVTKPKEHTGAMPPDGGAQLSKSQVQALAAYVWALGHQNAK